MKQLTRIDHCFARLQAAREKGFIAYITAGDPNLEQTLSDILLLEKAGVDIVELGIPFSDPLADGLVNQESAMRALASGTTIKGVLQMVRKLRRQSEMPIMCYCYMNLLFAPGFQKTIRQAAAAGVDGMLILDMPSEESGGYAEMLAGAGLNHITLITPTTPEPRIAAIVRHASGFVYAVSRTGVTGMQSALATDADRLLKRARARTDVPLALGFGISNPEQAKAAARHADAVVVGSAIVKRLHEAGASARARKQVGDWVRTMVEAVKE
jgi:tryptophan synthase alpha chain